MDTQQRLYPIGRQDFAEIRTAGNFLYVDKTEYVYRMTHSGAKFIFLSRPRRFGKSLLVSTLHSYFEGRRELFQGLAIEALEKDWTVYPVLHFDMSVAKHTDKEQLELMLDDQLSGYERIYGLKSEKDKGPNLRLKRLIETACTQTGQKVVVLIDGRTPAGCGARGHYPPGAPQRHAQLLQPPQGLRPVSPLRLHDRHHQVLPAQHLQRVQ